LRESKRWTLEELAAKTGLTATSLSQMERGGGARPKNIKKLADALEVDESIIKGRIQKGEKPADIIEVAEKRDTYNKDTEKGFYGTESPTDPFAQAVADLRDIFNSGDRVLITALLANLYSFKRSAHRETENQTMRTEIDNLKSRLAAVEEKLKGGPP
jgi:transcriptional regulator with XRE-family HTH domain